MTLERYISGRFARTFLVVLGVFFGMMMMVEMVEQIGRFPDRPVSTAQLAGLAALRVPASLYRILPLVTILSAIALFVALARTSELVVIRAAGRSALRLLVGPVAVAFAIGVCAVLVLNPLVAATTKHYDDLVQRYSQDGINVLSISPEGLWLRQGDAGQQTVIRAARADEGGTLLEDVTFLQFDGAGNPLARIEADTAELAPGEWRLSGVKRWPLDTANPEAEAITEAEARLPSDLTLDRIRDGFGDPSEIPIWDLPAFIASLDSAGFSAARHRVWLQMEMALPVLLSGMVLLAAGFTMRHARFGDTGPLVLGAVLSGFAIFFLRNFAQVLGETGQIPVLLAAWSPPVACVLLALGLLLHMEDG